ncbi:MAG: RDD family protein [Flavobacteriales bacterium]|nr:RDD family protein [Flavobacteriales bacterium]
MDHLEIETAQNVVVHHEVASIGDRIVAWIIDRLVVIAWIIVWIVIAAISDSNTGTALVVIIIIALLPLAFYNLVCELVMDGQSIGKAAQKIKVARKDGGHPGLGQYLLRWVLRPIDQFYGLGLLVILINGKGQRLGDLAAGTTVVSLKQRVQLKDTLMTDVSETHQVRFPSANRLTDAQAAMIKEVMNNFRVGNRWALIEEMAEKVRTAIGDRGEELKPLDFLRTVLKDYVHITGQQGAGTGHFRGERPKT